MRGIGSGHRKTELMLIDAAILAATPFFVIYLGFYDFTAMHDVFAFGVVFYVLSGMIIFRLHGLYHRLWEYADARDFVIICTSFNYWIRRNMVGNSCSSEYSFFVLGARGWSR